MKTLAVMLSMVALLLPATIFGQVRHEFEVASIKPAMPLTPDTNLGMHVDGAQIRVTYFSLKDILAMAYPVRFEQIIGPDWLPSERFDIAAKLPDGATRAQIPEMLQALIQDRFQMKMHRDKKEFPVYSLEFAKSSSTLTEAPPDPDSEPGFATGNMDPKGGAVLRYGKDSVFAFVDNKIDAKKLPMTIFAEWLSRYMDRPVVDMTGLKGRYDFVLNLSPDDFRAMYLRSAISAGVPVPPQLLGTLDGSSLGSLYSALQRIGLKLQAGKAPLDVLVIDSIQKKPTEN
jgi:uncharacterized protein (TIGR03435 family)